MIESDSWVVGFRRNNGMTGTITSGSYANPREISIVYIPVLIDNESDEFEIYESDLVKVATEQRSMGPEVQYSAYREEYLTDLEEFWSVEFNVFEYPKGVFNMSQMLHSENITIFDGDPADLIDRI